MKSIEQPWGLVIVFSAFMNQFISFGIGTTFGVYLIEYLKVFDSSISLISVIGSVNIGVQLGLGPLASYLMRKMPYRGVCLLGACLSSVGLIVLPFAPNIPFLLFFYGILTGIGFCFVYIPSHALSGLWYDKNTGLATGVVTSGSALGGLVFPNVAQWLIDMYGWRGSLFIFAAINMHTLIFAALLRQSPVQIQASLEAKKKRMVSPNGNSKISQIETISKGHESTNRVHVKNKQQRENTQTSAAKSKKSPFMTMLTNGNFVLYFLNNILWNIGGTIPPFLGAEYFYSIGFTQTQSALLLSFFHGGVFVGCFIGGVLGNLRGINRVALFGFCNILFGIIAFLYPFSIFHTMTNLVVLNCAWGASFGMMLGLIIIVMTDIIGKELLGDGLGCVMLANGAGCTLGPPVAGSILYRGWLQDITGMEEVIFYFSGVITILSGIFILYIPFIKCLQRARGNKYVFPY